jgi:hypothetical protein
MDRANIEIAVVEQTIAEASDAQQRELNDLELTFVGGGVGEVTAH